MYAIVWRIDRRRKTNNLRHELLSLSLPLICKRLKTTQNRSSGYTEVLLRYGASVRRPAMIKSTGLWTFACNRVFDRTDSSSGCTRLTALISKRGSVTRGFALNYRKLHRAYT